MYFQPKIYRRWFSRCLFGRVLSELLSCLSGYSPQQGPWIKVYIKPHTYVVWFSLSWHKNGLGWPKILFTFSHLTGKKKKNQKNMLANPIFELSALNAILPSLIFLLSSTWPVSLTPSYADTSSLYWDWINNDVQIMDIKDFTGGPVVKNSPDNEGDKIQSLVWEDPTCHGAAKSVNCNYWAPYFRALSPQL